ncbi:hypothetical protein [Bacillus sp. FDAARGOS_1420]|uniref:hypothetical protein n=1 Tax=unclassified Bacillus (in: firmicutes) TaxID=185979 RepID=UPI001C5B91A0|nr:hypothetical protein [Bacillus sp. FDAARGOS_1420]MBW3496793.1 hypothetical protein [Bacillus sp. FDAARGOS_1420]
MKEFSLSKRLQLIAVFIEEVGLHLKQESSIDIKNAKKVVKTMEYYNPKCFLEIKIPLFVKSVFAMITQFNTNSTSHKKFKNV